MRILVAPDKFKDSLGAKEVAECIAAGLREVMPEAEIRLLPIADGGEGFASVICSAANGTWHEWEVHDPLGRIVRARYCTIENGAVAVLEMSEASGLWRVLPNERNPLTATSFGTGEMMLDAARRGAKQIIIGLGGSATNDGGFGMARALGFQFFDDGNNELPGVAELARLARIKKPKAWLLPSVVAATDVRNHLLGKEGATRVFGPQKGASPAQIEFLEEALARLADVVTQDFGEENRAVAGTGAAGGLAFGLMSFCGAKIRPGFDVVAERVGLEEAVRTADLVITGEGKLDAQTLEGKAPAGVARLARKLGKKVYAIVGATEKNARVADLFDEVFPLACPPLTLEESIKDCARLLRLAGRELAVGARDKSSRSRHIL